MKAERIIAISHHQKEIEWGKVSKDGVSHVFSRLGEGKTFIDKKFVDYFKKSKEVGISAGAWHLYRAKSSTPDEQAGTIIKKLKEAGFSKGDSFVFAVYDHLGDNKTSSRELMSDNLYKLIQLILHSDLPVCKENLYIKTNVSTWKNSVAWERHDEFFKSLELWVDHWRDEPNYPDTLYPWGKGNWRLWEFSGAGKVDGINGGVMVSKFNAMK